MGIFVLSNLIFALGASMHRRVLLYGFQEDFQVSKLSLTFEKKKTFRCSLGWNVSYFDGLVQYNKCSFLFLFVPIL